MTNIIGPPNADGEYPYDPHETFSEDELQAAAWWRARGAHQTATRHDDCPHTPACQTVTVCLEEIAWYLRHRHALDGQDVEL